MTKHLVDCEKTGCPCGWNRPAVIILCAGPHCGRVLAVDGDWPQLDVPGCPVRLFCGLKCLRVWVQAEVGA